MDFIKTSALIGAVSAILGWWLTSYADRVLKAPNLEFSVAVEQAAAGDKCAGLTRYRLNLANISTSARLPAFRIVLRLLEDNSGFPAAERNCVPQITATGVGDVRAPSFLLVGQQGEIEFAEGVVAGSSFTIPIFAETSNFEAYQLTFVADGDIRIIEKNFETWVLRNETTVLFVMAGLLMILYLIGSARLIFEGRRGT